MSRNSAHKSCIKCDKNDRHICARKLGGGILKQVTYLSEVSDCLAVSNKIYTFLDVTP